MGSCAAGSERWVSIRNGVLRALETSESGTRSNGREVRLQRNREEGEWRKQV